MSPDLLAEPLKQILDAELASGNEIKEVSTWGPKCDLLVLLRRPFKQQYGTTPEVEFVEINDPHYWKAEYRYRGGIHALACGFES